MRIGTIDGGDRTIVKTNTKTDTEISAQIMKKGSVLLLFLHINLDKRTI